MGPRLNPEEREIPGPGVCSVSHGVGRRLQDWHRLLTVGGYFSNPYPSQVGHTWNKNV